MESEAKTSVSELTMSINELDELITLMSAEQQKIMYMYVQGCSIDEIAASVNQSFLSVERSIKDCIAYVRDACSVSSI